MRPHAVACYCWQAIASLMATLYWQAIASQRAQPKAKRASCHHGLRSPASPATACLWPAYVILLTPCPIGQLAVLLSSYHIPLSHPKILIGRNGGSDWRATIATRSDARSDASDRKRSQGTQEATSSDARRRPQRVAAGSQVASDRL